MHHVIETIVKRSAHLKWMEQGTVLLVRHGSHAYGTNTPASDEDFKGVAIPPKEYFLGATSVLNKQNLKLLIPMPSFMTSENFSI